MSHDDLERFAQTLRGRRTYRELQTAAVRVGDPAHHREWRDD